MFCLAKQGLRFLAPLFKRRPRCSANKISKFVPFVGFTASSGFRPSLTGAHVSERSSSRVISPTRVQR